jgi:hypothetical protein
VRYRLVAMFAMGYPTIKPLQQLSAVRTGLSGLIEELKAGRKRAIAVALDQNWIKVKNALRTFQNALNRPETPYRAL